MGWTVWAGTMAMAPDYDEVRLAGALGILFAAALQWRQERHRARRQGGTERP